MQIDMKESQIPIQKVNPDTEICQASNASVRSLPDILGSQNEEKERTISQADNTDSLKFNQEVLVQRQKQVSFLGWIKQVLKLNNIYQISKSISLESSIQNERKPPNHKSLKEHLTIENDESSNLEDNQNKNLSTLFSQFQAPTEIVNNPQSQMCSFIKELFFFHIIKKIQKINKEIKLGNQTLKLRDLPPISENNKIESYIHKYQAPLTKNLEKKENINFYKLFFWQIDSHFTILMLILGIVESNSNFLISLLLNYLVEDFQENNLEQSYFLCFSLFIISMIGILSRHYQYTQLSKHGGKVKQIITNFLMGKLNEINHCSIQLAKSGSILNLISSDLSSLESQYGYIYCIPIVPISLIFSGWILWDKFQGAYGLIALLICILTYPTQTLIQKCIQQKMKHLKEHQDFRIKQQSNFFDNLQTIKMYCWQDQLQQRIFNTRCKEWKQYILIQLFTLIDRSINQSINIWGSFLFLVIIYNLNVTLTLQNVILTIQLMGSIRYYCVHQVSYGLKAIITLNVIFKRIQDFLNISPLFGKQILQNNQQQHQEDQQDNDIENNKVVSQFSLLRTSDYESQRTKLSLSMIEDEQIQIRQLNCFWDSNKPPILKNITFSAHRGQLICLIGKTGSGKTTFLQLLLKEVPFVQGMMDFSEDFTFGYVEQEPFISPTSIKDNILFGKQFDQELFNEVIKASNIQQDILAMPDLENTIIGDNGATLSGGQKVRLSLARALYSMPDIYLLDDPLSAVDSKVAKHIFTQAIKKFIFQYQTQKQNYLVPLVIMTTHQLQYAQKCDYIVVLEEGKIISQGKSTIIAAHIEKMLNVQPADLNETPTQQKPEKTQNLSLQMLKLKRKQSLEIDQLTNEDIKKTISQLMEYISVSRLVLLLFFNIITEVIRNLFYHYLTYFIDEEGINKYCAIIIVLVISNFFNNIIKYALCSHAILTTNNKIFSKTMTIIGKSKKENFENIPSSVILNKFSTDFSIVDSQMAFILIDIFEDGTQFFFSLLTLGYFQPYFFAPILISVFLSNKLLQNFSHVLSQLKLNDLAQRAPQLQFLKTNLKGLTHFRLTNYFKIQKKHINSLADNSFQSNFFYHQTQKCFSQCIDLIALFTKTSGMLLIIAFIKDSSLFSQALLLLQSFHSQNTLLRQLMELGGLLNSYQRLFQITEIETEQENTCKNVLPQAWPKLGNIKLKDLSLSYSKNQVPVLNQLNLEIKEREKVAFIGRTGAGKSSVINALFRLNEINEESQILIDGQNVKELSLCQLRKTFSIIPQQPFIFYGSIRENLDPEHSYSDRDIWSSLSEVRMDKYFEQQPAKLETNILELNLSSGQKQLICLARVILMRSKILILDEPSANIDMITDNQIQEIIREKFMHCTVITIAHRLNTISFYDKVIVLESGQIVEQGNPFELLCDDQEGNKIDKSSKFAEMIQETGQKNAQQFFQISKEYYKINQIKQKIKSII